MRSRGAIGVAQRRALPASESLPRAPARARRRMHPEVGVSHAAAAGSRCRKQSAALFPVHDDLRQRFQQTRAKLASKRIENVRRGHGTSRDAPVAGGGIVHGVVKARGRELPIARSQALRRSRDSCGRRLRTKRRQSRGQPASRPRVRSLRSPPRARVSRRAQRAAARRAAARRSRQEGCLRYVGSGLGSTATALVPASKPGPSRPMPSI